MSNSAEQHRHDCEVRTIAHWPLARRRWYLGAVERARGPETVEKLRRSLVELWIARAKAHAAQEKSA